MIKILSLVPYKIFPAQDGGQRGIALFNEHLAKEANLVCVTVKSNDPQLEKGYEVLNILSDSPLRYINVFLFFTLRKIIRQRGITHLILEHPYYAWLGLLVRKFTGVKVIVHSHNIEALRFKTLNKSWWKLLGYYERWAHRNADYNYFIQKNDRLYAIEHYGVDARKCITITYGIHLDAPPAEQELVEARQALRSLHNIAPDETILFFNGRFSYFPNIDALYKIIEHINPILQSLAGFKYRIIVAGRGIPEEVSRKTYPNMILTGFVDDISLYFKGSDVFINPVTEGGGIKTKLVEALAYNLNAVSTVNGAVGVEPELCNGKLLICNDGDWKTFAALVRTSAKIDTVINADYFEHFYWGNIVKKAISFIRDA